MQYFNVIAKLCFLCYIVIISGCKVQNATQPIVLAKALQGLSQSAYIGSLMTNKDRLKQSQSQPSAVVGEVLYQRYCEDCHSISNDAPRLMGNYKADVTSESDTAIIRYGLKEMPGFRSKLTPYQVTDILAYLRETYYIKHPEEKESENNKENSEQN